MSETTKGAVERLVETATERDALLFDFGVDSPKLGIEHTKYLEELIKFLEISGSGPMVVSIDGFASRTGTAQHNLDLSRHREEAVVKFLKSKTKVFDPGQPHTLNTKFEGFSGSPPGENAHFRSVRVVVHRPGVIPPPIPIPPKPSPGPTPTPSASTNFSVDLVGWIPQPEVDNPLSLLPAFIKSLLTPGMADPFFGGDDFVTPDTTPAATIKAHTFRAIQHMDFSIGAFGGAPVLGSASTTSGITTCLSDRRSAGGRVTFSLKATLLRHSESVTFSSSDDWYEIRLSGVVLDPVPAEAARVLTSKLPGVPASLRAPLTVAIRDLATKATPSLSWDATIRLQKGPELSFKAKLEYVAFINSESSGTLTGATSALTPGSDLIHGKIHFSKWPSAVIYLTASPPGGASITQPVFFSSGKTVSKPETLQIEIPKLCKTRQINWKA
jgi:hypothetical protein